MLMLLHDSSYDGMTCLTPAFVDVQRVCDGNWTVFYHPPWNLPELESCRRHVFPTPATAEDVAQSFFWWGGSAKQVRHACHSDLPVIRMHNLVAGLIRNFIWLSS